MEEARLKIFVTGAAGFLGSQVMHALIDDGHEVAGCDNYVTSDQSRLHDRFHFLNADVREIRDWTGFYGVAGSDLVVHCAAIARSTWPNEAELWEHNVKATQAVLEWGVPVIFASSSVVGVLPTTAYSRTKAVAERLVLGRPGNLALRFGNIYGPGQSEDGPGVPNVVAAMRRHQREMGWVKLDGDGLQTRRFVHVTDAARAVVAAVNSTVRGTWMDICGEEVTIWQIGRCVTGTTGLLVEGPRRANDPPEIPQDPTPAKVLLGWEPTIYFEQGIKELLAPPA